jgi:hypothetical protein
MFAGTALYRDGVFLQAACRAEAVRLGEHARTGWFRSGMGGCYKRFNLRGGVEPPKFTQVEGADIVMKSNDSVC